MLEIVLFRKGRPGIVAGLPGEKPEEELSLALGGAVEVWPINERLLLFTLDDGEKLRLPFLYRFHRKGKVDEPIAGDCAVAAVSEAGKYIDVTLVDCNRAAEAVIPVTGMPS